MADVRIFLGRWSALLQAAASLALVAGCASHEESQESRESGEPEATTPSALAGSTLDVTLPTGVVRVFRPATAPASCEAVLFGVGTGLTTSSYQSLGSAINGYGYVFVVMDHAPGNAFGKADAARYAALAADVKANLLGWLGASSPCAGVAHWIVGGHSASGQAAHAAAIANPQIAHAIFSADPYDVSGLGSVTLPGLYWGFSSTTCFVGVNKAAKAAYARTPNPGRAMHKTNTTMTWALCGYVPKYHHQSFIDYGLNLGTLGCSNCIQTPTSFYADVANSLNKFVVARFYGSWSKANLQVSNRSTPATLYVDGDQP